MTDLQTQLDAILNSAAFAPITDRAFLRITGPDATRWLNGMVTNNIKDLVPGEGNYNFLLNAQGRILGDCMIYREPGDAEVIFLLETSTDQIDFIQQHLDKFIIMDDVELAPAMQDKVGLLVLGPGALGTLDAGLIWPTAPVSMSYSKVDNNAVPGDEIVLSLATNRYELWGDESHINWIRSLGDRQLSPEAVEAFRILSGTPRYGIDIRNTEANKDLPQETAQNHALNFNKGCYVGQEIVERIHSRGNVHRTFTKFKIDGAQPVVPEPLDLNGKTVGEITSATTIGETVYALGYIRREALNQPLTYPGGAATASN